MELTVLRFRYSIFGHRAADLPEFERRGNDETIYQFLDRQFHDASPLKASEWVIVGATIRIVTAPQDGQRRKTLTITLRTPNTTTIPNKADKDRQFAIGLLDRWNLIASPPVALETNEAD